MEKATKANLPLKHRGRVTFLALKDKIQERLEKGWFLIDVYKVYADALGVSYSQFARYVATHIHGKEVKTRQCTKAPTSQSRPDDAVHSNTNTSRRRSDGPIVTPIKQPKRFIFDPTAAHRRKDELI